MNQKLKFKWPATLESSLTFHRNLLGSHQETISETKSSTSNTKDIPRSYQHHKQTRKQTNVSLNKHQLDKNLYRSMSSIKIPKKTKKDFETRFSTEFSCNFRELFANSSVLSFHRIVIKKKKKEKMMIFQRGSENVIDAYLRPRKNDRMIARNKERRTGRTRHTNWTRKTEWALSWNFGTGRLMSFRLMRCSVRFRSVPFSSTETTILTGIEPLLRASLFVAPVNLLSLLCLRFSPWFDHVFFDPVTSFFFFCFNFLPRCSFFFFEIITDKKVIETSNFS